MITDGLPASAASDATPSSDHPSLADRPSAPLAFVPETEAYALLAAAGVQPPRHGTVGAELPLAAGEPVVLKGLGEELWHKSELGCVRFLALDPAVLTREAEAMRTRMEAAGHRWLAGLVCERLTLRRQADLPSEGFVSLSRSEAGWVLLCGCGGLQAEALAELAPPCRWPLAAVTPDDALRELEAHLLGRIWLGRLRGTQPLTTTEQLRAFLQALWRLSAVAEADGLTLLELNPVALDPTGTPRPLDAVGRRVSRPVPLPAPPGDFLRVLRTPRRIALAGVSQQPGGVGRTILENLRRYGLPPEDLVLIKPGHDTFLDLPCLPDVSSLRSQPVDLLILALPAPAAVATLQQLLEQGGGAPVVALVSGGIGDGADTAGFGTALSAALCVARQSGRWTPAVLGPNFLGHWVPASRLDTSFIPIEKIAAPDARGGRLTLLSQSGAFLLGRRSRQPRLRFDLGISLGNQLDVSLADVLTELAAEPQPGPVACYVEGFAPGQIERVARAAATLTRRGARVLLHRAGRTAEGRAAAASHTGAMAGDLTLERALLERSGVRFSDSLAEFDAALAWLAAFPWLATGPVGLVTNAGFESVNGSDLFGPRLCAAALDEKTRARLQDLLAAHRLDGLVAPRLPLDLTPMAGEPAFLAAVDLLLPQVAALVVGLVPFTRNLTTHGEAAAAFTRSLAALAQRHERPLAVAVDAGPDYAGYRAAFAAAGLPVFDRVEDALLGLRALATERPQF